MLREQVRDYYRGQGYQVLEDAKVLGASGQTHRVEMLVRGSLGYLVVAFPDAGGFEGPEMGAVRRVARDIEATPVVAAPSINPTARAMAMKMGVVLLDMEHLQHEIPINSDEDWPASGKREAPAEAHPWPKTGRARPEVEGVMRASSVDDLLTDWSGKQLRDEPHVTANESLWKQPRREAAKEAAAPRGTFSWLAKTGATDWPNEPEAAAPEPNQPAASMDESAAEPALQAPLVSTRELVSELPGKELIPPVPFREPKPEPVEYYRRPDGGRGRVIPSTARGSLAPEAAVPSAQTTKDVLPQAKQLLAIIIFGIVVALTLFLLLFVAG